MKIVVIKIGGSLFNLPNLRSRLEEIFRQRKDHAILLIAGGGSAVDIVRKWDQLHQLGDEISHWLALKAMEINEKLLQSIVENSRIVSSQQEAEIVWSENGICILNCFGFLKIEEKNSTTILPHTWNTTSDSIAAWVARHWSADELCLLKSINAPNSFKESLDAVDSNFATIISRLQHLTWCNLREGTEIEQMTCDGRGASSG